MKQTPKKRHKVRIDYGQFTLPNLTKGQALKIADELLQEYDSVKITIQKNEKPN
jgi:hypothetical protein